MNKNKQSKKFLAKLRKILNRYYAAAGISGLLILLSGISDLLIYPCDRICFGIFSLLAICFWAVCWQTYASLENAMERAPKWAARPIRRDKPKSLRKRGKVSFWIIIATLVFGVFTFWCWPFSVRSVFLSVLTVTALCRLLWGAEGYRSAYYFLTKEEE